MRSNCNNSVMPGLVPGIHVFLITRKENVDGRDEPGHDER
jgi:hydroxymethylglutaryl-CoA lyase